MVNIGVYDHGQVFGTFNYFDDYKAPLRTKPLENSLRDSPFDPRTFSSLRYLKFLRSYQNLLFMR